MNGIRKFPWVIFMAFVSSAIWTNTAWAARDLRNDANLHPLDTFTADTLEEDEWHYGQPPIPAPGYNFIGLTNRWTAQLDYTAWLGGVPSLNFRYALSRGNPRFNAALEFMTVYIGDEFYDEFDELDEDQDHLFIKREGLGAYVRVNTSYRLNQDTRLHFSLGASYSEFLEISNEDRSEFVGDQWDDLYDPIFMLGAEYFIKDNLMFVTNISYGETWMLMENRPRKEQFVYGFRWAPFIDNKKSIWNNLSFDLIALYSRFPDAEEEVGVPVPVFPLATWQWHTD